MRAGLFALGSVLVAALVPACSSEEILLLTLPEGSVPSPEDGGLDAMLGPSCDEDRECGPSAYCQKRTCGERRGNCERKPAFCDGAPSPVCGCDGVTYWNDCLRKSRGQRSSFPGECPVPQAAPCGEKGAKGCPPGATCAKIAPLGGCSPEVPGVCWVAPAACPPSSGVDRFVRCGPPEPSPPCVDLCAAIRAGAPHARAESCP